MKVTIFPFSASPSLPRVVHHISALGSRLKFYMKVEGNRLPYSALCYNTAAQRPIGTYLGLSRGDDAIHHGSNNISWMTQEPTVLFIDSAIKCASVMDRTPSAAAALWRVIATRVLFLRMHW
jgi:hypothetical protein